MAEVSLIPINHVWRCPYCVQMNTIEQYPATNVECNKCHEKFGVVGSLGAGLLISDKEVQAHIAHKERAQRALGEQT